MDVDTHAAVLARKTRASQGRPRGQTTTEPAAPANACGTYRVSLQYNKTLMEVICMAVFHLPSAFTLTACTFRMAIVVSVARTIDHRQVIMLPDIQAGRLGAWHARKSGAAAHHTARCQRLAVRRAYPPLSPLGYATQACGSLTTDASSAAVRCFSPCERRPPMRRPTLSVLTW